MREFRRIIAEAWYRFRHQGELNRLATAVEKVWAELDAPSRAPDALRAKDVEEAQ